ncbi:carboxypeptidase-like regulatory domain-containing protein [Winogradskyella sp. R77965]|uniref:carboxypeptidase-like regulatory domain-containing protein n=1 Tax=Winogradskyella sp. R77965 TaxID=3093872 RepID=UPI0037DC4F00
MKKIVLALFSLFTLISFSQEITRISVNGRIIVSTNDKEGVAVYNTSSNKGTTTDAEGNFKIKVTVNDIIEFSALQFQDFSVTVTEDVIKSKQLTVILVEEVNKLDEVVLLPFGLTGNLNSDLENVRTYNVSLDYVYFGLDHIEDFEFTTDYKSKIDNPSFDDYTPRVDNMLNIINLAGFLVSQVADIDKEKSITKIEKEIKKTPFKEALDKYSINYIHSNFNIPLDQVAKFIDYVEVQGVEDELLKEDKEMQFLERITQLSESFLKLQSEKD